MVTFISVSTLPRLTNSQPYLSCNSRKYCPSSLAFRVGLLLFTMCVSSAPLLSLTGLLLISSQLSLVTSNGINFCIGRWHTVFPGFGSAPLTSAFFPITNLFIFPIRHWVRRTFSSPLISTLPNLKHCFLNIALKL